MQLPSITAAYLAVLTLLYLALGLLVVRLRVAHRAWFGDGGHADLRSAIRGHSHFAEYVPLIGLMAAMLEMSGLPAFRLHLLMGALLVARVLHPLGMYAKPGTLQVRLFRLGGTAITFAVMTACAVLTLSRLLRGA